MAQWRLGDLATQNVIAYSEGSLRSYAENIGVYYENIRHYRWVANAYEMSVRTDISFTNHRLLAPRADRHGTLSPVLANEVAAITQTLIPATDNRYRDGTSRNSGTGRSPRVSADEPH